MTTIAAVMRRSYTADMFDDLTDVPHARSWDKATGVTTLTFDADLDEQTTAAIRDRMTSKDDDDQAARANLRVLRDAVEADPTLANVAALVVANTNYGLGEAT